MVSPWRDDFFFWKRKNAVWSAGFISHDHVKSALLRSDNTARKQYDDQNHPPRLPSFGRISVTKILKGRHLATVKAAFGK
jgi:hypothetical protein